MTKKVNFSFSLCPFAFALYLRSNLITGAIMSYFINTWIRFFFLLTPFSALSLFLA